jgi:hypothetical protein
MRIFECLKRYTKRILKCQHGGFDLLQVLGLKPKRPDIGPIVNVPPPDMPRSLTEFPVTKDLNELIRRGMTEGYGKDFVGRTTSPLTAQREARFQRQELPFLESQMSSRGLSRSSIAGREIGELSQQKERDINEMIARAVMANEAEKARQQQMAFGFGGAEAGLKGGAETAAYNAAMQKAMAEFGAGETGRLETQANVNKLIASAMALGTGQAAELPGIWAGGGGDDRTQWQQAMNVKQAEQASPFTSKKKPFQSWYDSFKNMGTSAPAAMAVV